MKNTRKCPKCNVGEDNILRIPGYGGRDGNNVPSGGLWNVALTRFACGACGYSEEWIESPEDITRLRKKYPTLSQEEQQKEKLFSRFPSLPSALSPIARCSQCEAPLIDFGHGLQCPRCSP